MDIRHFSFIGSYIKRIEKNILELGFQKIDMNLVKYE